MSTPLHEELEAVHRRAAVAAFQLRHQATTATPPELRHLVVARRVGAGAVVALSLLVAGAVSSASVLAPGWLPWMVGAAVGSAVLVLVLIGIHAGGHGWFVPLPVVVLAGAWTLTASAGAWDSPAGWSLAALCLLCALVGAVLIVPAIAYRHAPAVAAGASALVGAHGTAVTDLAPSGIAKVNNESWTAQSLSGPLLAGAPVHVARVEGLRLLVWSEMGTVPGSTAAIGAVGIAEPNNNLQKGEEA
jgi:hypothetical protein